MAPVPGFRTIPGFACWGVGEMAEWLKAHAWKACLGETLTWVRIPLSPPASLSCREFPSPFPAEFVNSAHISQSLPAKPDCGERTRVQPPVFNCAFFSEGEMSSPTLSTFVRRRQGDQRS